MNASQLKYLAVAFGVGVLSGLLLSRSPEGRYVPFGPEGTRLLDTRNGCLYKIYIINGKHKWEQSMPRVE